MNRRLIGVFTFALIVAAATSALAYKLMMSRTRDPVTKGVVAANHVLVAGHDLQIGALIAAGDLDEVAWAGPVPDQAIKKSADLIGRGVIATIYKYEPITDARLAARGAGAGLAATIPIGQRAVALRVNEVIGLAGFVLPGMRVDVLIAGNAPGTDAGGMRCRTILQNIQVLSAGQRIEKSVDGKPEAAEVVNLLVTPDQAEILNLASSEAKVQLVLRNPLDTTEEPTHGTNVATLFGMKALPVERVAFRAAAAPVLMPTVEMYNGTKRSDQAISPSLEKHQ
jgi:pilus assembly protein CpaB